MLKNKVDGFVHDHTFLAGKWLKYNKVQNITWFSAKSSRHQTL